MSPVVYATGPAADFASLNNTDWVVTLGFAVFIGVLVYFQVPKRLAGMLDGRAEKIRGEIEEARSLREEAQTILASYERRQKEVADQAASIVSAAKADAEAAAAQAKKDLEVTLERRLQAATDRIDSAEKAAVKEVRDTAASVAVAAAARVLAERLEGEEGGKMIDRAIDQVSARLN